MKQKEEEVLRQLFATPIEDLDFPNHIFKALVKSDVMTLGDLVGLYRKDVAEILRQQKISLMAVTIIDDIVTSWGLNYHTCLEDYIGDVGGGKCD